MLYIQSLIVYLSLLAGMTVTSQWAIYNRKNIFFFLPIILFSIIFGLRYGVGIDFYAYLRSFSASESELNEYYEPGLIFIVKSCRFLDLGSNSFFFILAFIQISFLYFSFRQQKAATVFLPSALILTGIAMMGYMNIIRQTIAFCIFAFAVDYIARKKLICYVFFVFLAFLFHKSALILLPLYFIWSRKDSYFNNVTSQIILACIAFFTAIIIDLPTLLGYFDTVLELMGYSRYLGSDRIDGNSTIGLGYIMVFALYFIIIAFNKEMKLFYASKTFNIMYDFFYIGVLCEFLFRGSMMMNRITYYFNGFKTIFIAYVLYFLYKNRKKSPILYYSYLVAWAILIITFIRCIIQSDTNTVQYVFSFQEELHEIKHIQFNNAH